MKTYLVPSKFRHSVIGFFDDLVAKKQVTEFFVGSADTAGYFPLTYQIVENRGEPLLGHFNPLPSDKQYEYRIMGDVNPVGDLKDALAHISMGDNYMERDYAIAAIMDYCDISLSIVDFENDGQFQVESSLEFK